MKRSSRAAVIAAVVAVPALGAGVSAVAAAPRPRQCRQRGRHRGGDPVGIGDLLDARAARAPSHDDGARGAQRHRLRRRRHPLHDGHHVRRRRVRRGHHGRGGVPRDGRERPGAGDRLRPRLGAVRPAARAHAAADDQHPRLDLPEHPRLQRAPLPHARRFAHLRARLRRLRRQPARRHEHVGHHGRRRTVRRGPRPARAAVGRRSGRGDHSPPPSTRSARPTTAMPSPMPPPTRPTRSTSPVSPR